MSTFYLFRHGETYYSKNLLPYNEHELTAGILPEAVVSIKKLAFYLNEQPITKSFRSEFLRCAETAAIIEKETELVFEPDSLLNEFTEKEFDLFHSRMEKLVLKLENLKDTHIALCTHGAVVAALQNMLLSKPFHARDLMAYPKTGVIVKLGENGLEKIDFN